MAEIYDMTANISITNAVEYCDLKNEVPQIVNYARNGAVFIQILGSPKKFYEVVCHVTKAQVTLLETAWASGNLIKVTFLNDEGTGNTLSYGRIIDFEKDHMGYLFDRTTWHNYYKVNLKLAYEEVTQTNS